MNKLTLVFILFSLILGVGCQVEQTDVSPIPIIATTETGVGTAVSPIPIIAATETGVGTAVSTPTRPATATSTPLPTATKRPTHNLLVPPAGELYFLWDSKQMPNSIIDEPIQSLYLALPGITPTDWQIKPLLDNLIGVPYSALSPDKTKFAFTILEDKNNDGYISFESYNMWLDAPNLYIYSLKDGSFERVTENYPDLYEPTWLADNQTIVSRQSSHDIVSVNTTSHIIESIYESPETMHWILVSPGEEEIAVNFDSGKVSFLDPLTGQLTDVASGIGGFGVDHAWSLDGRWLALTQWFNGLFFLVNTQTNQSIAVPELNAVRYPAWSPDSQQLALIQGNPDGSTLVLFNPEDGIITPLLNMPAEMRDLLWSPDGSQLAFSIWQDDGISLGVVDIDKNEFRELWHMTGAGRFKIPAWSPDGQWLLFHSGRLPLFTEPSDPVENDQSGLYLIHQSGGEPIQLLDTSEGLDPYDFYWLHDTEQTP